MLSNITLPTLSEVSDKQNMEKIRGYLATLHDQLRYMMLNIDMDNLSDSLSETIFNASENAEYSKNELASMKESVVSIDNTLSSLIQTADKINWFITDSTDTSEFTLTPNAVSVISKSVDLTGLVKFSDLEQTGSTVINGSNISAGSVSADKLSVSDLSALAANIGGWSLSASSISSKASDNGSIYLNSAYSNDPYWIKAVSPWGYTTFYIAKNGACYFDGSYISDGSITTNKIICDSDSRLDLTNNYRGIKVGHEMLITNGTTNCRLFVNNSGILTFDTGTGTSTFSLSLTRSGSAYSLNVHNGSGQIVGTINL